MTKKHKYKQPEGLEPGIYFNMSNDDYHNDTALSRGGMVHLLDSYLDYWMNSSLNPDRGNKTSDAMIEGTRKHQLLLEPRTFFDEYSVTGSGWEPGKKLINRADFERIKESIQEIMDVPKAYRWFQGGMPEVTIIFIDPESGIRIRIRIDYLQTIGGVDYKTCKSIQIKELGWVISQKGYDIQQDLYQQGIAEAKKLLRAGKFKVFGNPDKDWLNAFIKEDTNIFRFLFQRSRKPYIFDLRKIDDEILADARICINIAKRVYKTNVEIYGSARPPAGDGDVKEITKFHMPASNRNRGDHHIEGE